MLKINLETPIVKQKINRAITYSNMLKEKSPYKQKNKIVLKALSTGKRSEPWHDIYSL